MRQGEVWLVDFAPQVGQEVKKRRPAIIVSNNTVGLLALKIVVPITNPPKNNQNWHIHLVPQTHNGLTKNSVADCFQIKSISGNRFIHKLGELNEDELSDVKIAMMLVLDLV